MKKRIALVVIDPQYDFTNPNGKLYVKGAEQDMIRLANFVDKLSRTGDELTIITSLDSHRVGDIAHPSFWVDKDGNHPTPFTQITYADIVSGRWVGTQNPLEQAKYIAELEKQGEFTHTIWPEHCLIGTPGHCVDENLMKAFIDYEKRHRKPVIYVTKGTDPMTEHFGIFRANIPNVLNPSTTLNNKVIDLIMRNDIVYIAGEASTHCVFNSVRQLIAEIDPKSVSKLVLLSDCMSPVDLGGSFMDEITKGYKEFEKKGLTLKESTNI